MSRVMIPADTLALHATTALQPVKAKPESVATSAAAAVGALPDGVSSDSTAAVAAADSLAVADTSAARSVGDFPYTDYCPANPLCFQFPLTPRYRQASAAEVFGTTSVPAAAQPLVTANGQSLTGSPVFHGFVLLLAVAYMILLYRNPDDVKLLLSRLQRDNGSAERLTDEPGNSGFSRFLNLSAVIGLLFIGVLAVKYGDSLLPKETLARLSHSAVLLLSLAAAFTVGFIVLLQNFCVRIIGAVTLSEPLTGQLRRLKMLFFSLCVVVVSPTLLLFALCPRYTGDIWFYVVAIELLATLFLYLKETLRLFISKKISILHWFLYLCTVEIFPFSLLWLAAGR